MDELLSGAGGKWLSCCLGWEVSCVAGLGWGECLRVGEAYMDST